MADYFGVLTDLKTQRKALLDEADDLEGVINGLERLVAKESASKPALERPLTFQGMNLAQAVRAYVESVNRPQTTREVAEALKAGGVPSAAKTFANQVYNILHNGVGPDGHYRRDGTQWRLRSG